MLMHCSEELLRDKDRATGVSMYPGTRSLDFALRMLKELVLAALHECGTALRFVPLPLRRDHEVQMQRPRSLVTHAVP